MSARRVLVALAILLAGFAPPAGAQLRIGLKLEHNTVLQFEAIRAFITVYNDGREIMAVTGQAPDALPLRFHVEDNHGVPERRFNDAPISERMTILPGGNIALMKDMTDWFRFLDMKHYIVMVDGTWQGDRFESNRETVSVVPGLVLSEIVKPLPGYRDRLRRYGLRYWKRDKYEHLFLRVDEETRGSSMNYGVVDLGPLIRVFKPTLTVDREGTVEIVHQASRDRFLRTVFQSDPDRLRFVDQTSQQSGGAPYADESTGDEGASGVLETTNDTNNADAVKSE